MSGLLEGWRTLGEMLRPALEPFQSAASLSGLVEGWRTLCEVLRLVLEPFQPKAALCL